MSPLYKFSPSELTFLWDECPRCFYLKHVHGIARPAAPFPKIFGRIDKLMKAFFQDQPTSEVALALPAGKVRFAERWVTSTPIELPGRASSAYIRGVFDIVIEFNDGSYGVVDFKTSETKPEHPAFYSRQLHAYAYALQNPRQGAFALSPISRLGLLSVEPVAMERALDGRLAYLGMVTWVEIPLQPDGFLAFIDAILQVLDQPQPPDPSPTCAYCLYRLKSRQHGL
jgi:CRISPR/Cas system-associated exonuclease Cas4 (RecB family)